MNRDDVPNSETGSIEEAVREIAEGKMIILVDSADRENEGDLIIAGEFATPEMINFMASKGRGLICVPMSKHYSERLNLHPMVENNSDRHTTAFTVSVDARQGTTTGISAFDRAKTVEVILDEHSTPDDLLRPGHIFPLKAVEGGVLKRAGHTEGTVDLARLAGLKPVGVLCEILNEDGSMARMPDLVRFAKHHSLNIYSVEDLIRYRSHKDSLIRREVEADLPTHYGDFKIVAYSTTIDDKTHVALVYGNVRNKEGVLVRMHSECLTGDIFHSARCDCGEQLESALSMIAEEGAGVLVYMRQEGRGIGLINKLKSYRLQDEGLDTVDANVKLGFPADLRDYGIGAQILCDLGLSSIRLLTNNPRKVVGLEGYGLVIEDRIPLTVQAGEKNFAYLKTKKERLGHLLDQL